MLERHLSIAILDPGRFPPSESPAITLISRTYRKKATCFFSG